MNHIVDTCPLTKSEGRFQLLYEIKEDAVEWLESIATKAFAKWVAQLSQYAVCSV